MSRLPVLVLLLGVVIALVGLYLLAGLPWVLIVGGGFLAAAAATDVRWGS